MADCLAAQWACWTVVSMVDHLALSRAALKALMLADVKVVPKALQLAELKALMSVGVLAALMVLLLVAWLAAHWA